MSPTWETLGGKYANTKVKISKIDCTQSAEICSENGIRGYPTLLFFINGEKVDQYSDARTIEGFSAFISRFLFQ